MENSPNLRQKAKPQLKIRLIPEGATALEESKEAIPELRLSESL